MTSDEKTEMANLNQKYKDKFGFPFIICVRLNKKEAIFGGLRSRLHNDRDQGNLLKGIVIMAIRFVEFSNGGYKIRKIFA